MGTAIRHRVADRVKPSFVIFDIRTLWRSAMNVSVGYSKHSSTWCEPNANTCILSHPQSASSNVSSWVLTHTDDKLQGSAWLLPLPEGRTQSQNFYNTFIHTSNLLNFVDDLSWTGDEYDWWTEPWGRSPKPNRLHPLNWSLLNLTGWYQTNRGQTATSPT